MDDSCVVPRLPPGCSTSSVSIRYDTQTAENGSKMKNRVSDLIAMKRRLGVWVNTQSPTTRTSLRVTVRGNRYGQCGTMVP